MKIKTSFTTILFYIISVIAFFIISISVSNPVISLLLLIIFTLSLYIGSFYLQKDNNHMVKKIMKITFLIMFIVYSIFTVSLLFSNHYFGREDIKTGINLIPFKTIFLFLNSANEHTLPTSAIITNLLGNLIAFTPLSFYLPLFFEKNRKFWFHILVVTIIIAIIEILQLILKCGSCDIDDIILNMLGIMLSYPIFNNKHSLKLIKKLTMF